MKRRDPFRTESGMMAQMRERRERNANEARRANLIKAREKKADLKKFDDLADDQMLKWIFRAKEIVVIERAAERKGYVRLEGESIQLTAFRRLEKKGLVTMIEEGNIRLGEVKWRVTLACCNPHHVTNTPRQTDRKIELD